MKENEALEHLAESYLKHLGNGLRIAESVEQAVGKTLPHAEAHRITIAQLEAMSLAAVGMAVFRLMQDETAVPPNYYFPDEVTIQ